MSTCRKVVDGELGEPGDPNFGLQLIVVPVSPTVLLLIVRKPPGGDGGGGTRSTVTGEPVCLRMDT